MSRCCICALLFILATFMVLENYSLKNALVLINISFYKADTSDKPITSVEGELLWISVS